MSVETRSVRTAEARGRSADLATAVEAMLPADLLARVDATLFGRTALQLVQGWTSHPGEVTRTLAAFAGVSARVASATLARAFGGTGDGPMPTGRDGRFKDTTWEENPAFWALRQEYLALTEMLEGLAHAAGLDPDSDERATMMLGLLASVLSPTNVLPGNPSALKRAFETGGSSVVSGLRAMLQDVATNNGRPQQVDRSKLRVGQELAATPGKVVYRNRLMELIQFEPQTDEVHEIPILASPPWINKYYVMDLSPERSLLEWAVQHGHTVFVISYRDPDETMSGTTFEDYLELGPLAALDVIGEITGAPKVDMLSLCLGGLLATITTAVLARRGDDRINSLTLLNTLLDYTDPGPVSSFMHPDAVDRIEKQMEQTGYLPADAMAGVFDMLRANDLIFNYVGPNWLEGRTPPSFDILAWNGDSTRMPAAMQSFYLRRFYLGNELARGELEVLGEQVSLKDVAVDTFIVAAENDHIAPWRTSFTSTRLLGGEVDFTLSTSGHIAGVVNPPSPKAKHWVGKVAGEAQADPDAWRRSATEVAGSWWETWTGWIAERSGPKGPPPSVGSDRHPPQADAPGAYVRGTGDA